MDTVDTRNASVPEDGEKIIEIQLERLRTFKNHPFKVRMDPEMIRLSASVEKYGIINPLIVRPIPDGVYEIISGHRRKAAAEKFGYRKVPVIIRVFPKIIYPGRNERRDTEHVKSMETAENGSKIGGKLCVE